MKHQHTEHTDQTSSTAVPSTRSLAIRATVHCLTGCGIGEVLGMAISTALGWHDLPSILLAVVLAFIFGYGLTFWPLVRGGMAIGQAFRLALSADTISIVTMEIMDNAIILLIPGAMNAGLGDFLFWASLIISLAVAFVVTLPVNAWLISRGQGHAVMHGHH